MDDRMSSEWKDTDDRGILLSLIAQTDQEIAAARERLDECRAEFARLGTRAALHRMIEARVFLADELAARRDFERMLTPEVTP